MTPAVAPRSQTLLTLLAALLAAASLAPPSRAQTITTLDTTIGTLGTIVRVNGTDLGAKPKLVLAQDGTAAKKTKLKVVGAGEGFVDVEVKAAFAGDFHIALRQGQQLLAVSKQTFTVAPPVIASVEPANAAPGDEVDLLVEFAGTGKASVLVGTTKAKITNVADVPVERLPLQRITVVVPAVPNGTWPVVYQNRIGSGLLKAALTVGGSTADFTKPGVLVDVVGRPLFKASKNKIVVNVGDADDFEIAALAGGAKAPRTFTLTLPTTLEAIQAGDSFSTLPANIVYTETKQGVHTGWFGDPAALGNSWVIDVVAATEEMLAIYACGCLTLTEPEEGSLPETVCVQGLVVAPPQNLPNTNPNDPARGYLVGTITGTLVNSITQEQQTVTGEFCTGWNNFSDF